LKEEVDNLTKTSSDSPIIQIELEQMKLANELFASQIVENEVEMRETQSMLKLLETEKAMRQEQDSVCGESKVESERNGVSEVPAPEIELLVNQIRSLAARLDNVERKRERVPQILDDVSERSQKELRYMRAPTELEDLSATDEVQQAKVEPVQNDSEVHEVGEEIEVTLHGPLDRRKRKSRMEKKTSAVQGQAMSSCGSICGCFPFSMMSSKEL
jgi:hypothetical protein